MNRSTHSRLALGALLTCTLGLSFLAQAQQDYGRFTAMEVARLPQYCQDRLNQKKNEGRWKSEFGPEIYLHIHHYCYGLIYYQRANTEFDSKKRRLAAKSGIADFNYVLQRWPANAQFYQQAEMYKAQLEFIWTRK